MATSRNKAQALQEPQEPQELQALEARAAEVLQALEGMADSLAHFTDFRPAKMCPKKKLDQLPPNSSCVSRPFFS